MTHYTKCSHPYHMQIANLLMWLSCYQRDQQTMQNLTPYWWFARSTDGDSFFVTLVTQRLLHFLSMHIYVAYVYVDPWHELSYKFIRNAEPPLLQITKIWELFTSLCYYHWIQRRHHTTLWVNQDQTFPGFAFIVEGYIGVAAAQYKYGVINKSYNGCLF